MKKFFILCISAASLLALSTSGISESSANKQSNSSHFDTLPPVDTSGHNNNWKNKVPKDRMRDSTHKDSSSSKLPPPK